MCLKLADFSSVFEVAVGVNLALSVLNEVSNPIVERFQRTIRWKSEVLFARVEDQFEKRLVAGRLNVINSVFQEQVDRSDNLKVSYSRWMFMCAVAAICTLIYSGIEKEECAGSLLVTFLIGILLVVPIFCAVSTFLHFRRIVEIHEQQVQNLLSEYF